MTTTTRNWRTARTAVSLGEVTDRMLAQAHRDADASRLAQTVWPSRWYGRDFLGLDCLLINACAAMDRRPEDAAKGGEPLLTVLPSGYIQNQLYALEAHNEGYCSAYCVWH